MFGEVQQLVQGPRRVDEYLLVEGYEQQAISGVEVDSGSDCRRYPEVAVTVEPVFRRFGRGSEYQRGATDRRVEVVAGVPSEALEDRRGREPAIGGERGDSDIRLFGPGEIPVDQR
ncbi:hypothetical protein [Nocardia sp. alder85J]|uniref:hypothetical protein n=1 Tax=Nocardia sp. alder85J TaxID=2862949 RepID=UPI001CD22E9B|nr:hypothetical protein [Nocardia sp. alder85J]MCX4097938.1 hypothetical protein [Nocardia sp. alder85J]